jgi:hypothetical protein
VPVAPVSLAAFALAAFALAAVSARGEEPASRGTAQTCVARHDCEQVSRSGPKKTPPHLVVLSISLKSTGPCKAGSIVYTYNAVVKNTGQTAYSGPAGTGAAVVLVDTHTAQLPGGGWAGGTAVHVGPIAPGKQATLAVQVPYYAANPSHMTAYATHPFISLAWNNNAYASSGPGASVAAPAGC